MNIAVAGLGFMGATHLKAWRQATGACVTAVVSSDARKLTGDLTSVRGNFGPAGEAMDFSSLHKYTSLDAALADPAIDALDICLPTDLHAASAAAALRAGKHVFLEKPMAANQTEAAALLDEARRSGRILMVGHLLRFLPAYQALAGELETAGPVRSAFFRRRCGAPTWSPRFAGAAARSGYGIFDLLIHDADYCIARWGLPDSVRATGYEDPSRGIDVVHAELQYPGSGPVILTGGWHHPDAYPFSMEFTVVTDRSTLEWSSAAGGLREYGCDGKASTRELAAVDPFAAELAYFAGCVNQGRAPDLCPPEQSAQAVALMSRIIASRQRAGEST